MLSILRYRAESDEAVCVLTYRIRVLLSSFVCLFDDEHEYEHECWSYVDMQGALNTSHLVATVACAFTDNTFAVLVSMVLISVSPRLTSARFTRLCQCDMLSSACVPLYISILMTRMKYSVPSNLKTSATGPSHDH